jgi:antitoxin component of MazEF toxin-antitoxin module
MPVFESNRKVQVFGSSLAVTLPAMFVKANEIEKGAVVKVLYCLDGVLILSRFEEDELLKSPLMTIIEKLEKKNNAQRREKDEDL